MADSLTPSRVSAEASSTNEIIATRVRGQAVADLAPAHEDTPVKLNQRRQHELLRDDVQSGAIPHDIASKFFRDGNKYYFRNRDLAFVDKGTTLTTQTLNQSVIQDLVRIAKLRHWEAARVTGNPAFRQAVWKEAYAEGIEVKGYEPTPLDQQQAQLERSRRQGRDSTVRPSATPVTDALAQASMRQVQPPNSDPTQGVVFGTYLEQGVAPYKNDPSKKHSPYIKVDVGNGNVQTYWGKGLPEALAQSKTRPEIGEKIGIEVVGKQVVMLPQARLDKTTGEVVTQSVATHRNVWVVEHPGYFLDTHVMAADVAARAGHAQPTQHGAMVAASMASRIPARDASEAQDRQAVAEARQGYENQPVSGRNVDPAKGVVLGRLIEHGIVADAGDPKALRTSYYVRLDIGDGVIETYRGLGVAEALRESRTRRGVGDEVGVMITGHRLVDPAKPGGEVVSTWVIEDPRYFRDWAQVMKDLDDRDQRAGQTSRGSPHTPFPAREDHGDQARHDTQPATPNGSSGPVVVSAERRSEHAAAVRNAALTREELQRRYPDISAAVFAQLAAQQKLADAFVRGATKLGYDMNAGDRNQVIQKLRDRLADKIEHGDTIKDVGVKNVDRAVNRAISQSYDEVGRAPRVAAAERSAAQVRVPKTLLREDVHVRA
jgi:hypothetical protein